MRKIKDITEDEMIAVFLKAEIASTRWMDTIVGLIEKDGISRDIIDNPNVQSDEENAYRRKLFDVFRGHTKRTRLFGGFPKNVRWARKMINKRELERVKYIKWGIWSEITGGTRSPIDAAKNILSGKVDQNQTRQFWEVADTIRQGASFPELILVGKDENSPLVVLEGHMRITAYFLRPEYVPSEMEVIVGFSKDMDKWSEY